MDPFRSAPQRLTVLGALACDGLAAIRSIEAATSMPVPLAYLDQVLVPALERTRADAILVMDNLRPHRAASVSELLAQARIGLIYLPQYTPEFNSIEHAWAKMKQRLNAKAPFNLEDLKAELKPTFDTINSTQEACFQPAAVAC
jgi:transposase